MLKWIIKQYITFMFSQPIKSFLMQYAFESVNFEYAKAVVLALVFITVGMIIQLLLSFIVTSINSINPSV